jgi:hypothetical protein
MPTSAVDPNASTEQLTDEEIKEVKNKLINFIENIVTNIRKTFGKLARYITKVLDIVVYNNKVLYRKDKEYRRLVNFYRKLKTKRLKEKYRKRIVRCFKSCLYRYEFNL